MAREITLTNGGIAFVDDEDFEVVSAFRWLRVRTKHTNYALHTASGRPMHRLLLGLGFRYPSTDHRDGDGLNNRRNNIRACTHAENARNLGLPDHNTSGILGVRWDSSRGKWYAYITVDYVMKNLGRFASKEDAISARVAAEALYFKDFAPSLCRAA